MLQTEIVYSRRVPRRKILGAYLAWKNQPAMLGLYKMPQAWNFILYKPAIINRRNSSQIQYGRKNINLAGGLSPQPTIVPNVVGLTLAAASTLIASAGLAQGFVTTQNSLSVPSGEVISQNPLAGVTAMTGSMVSLVISSGPGGIVVPSVMGLTQIAAITALEAAGFVLIELNVVYNSPVANGLVCGQNPSAGTVSQITVVQMIYVSQGPSIQQETSQT
jgi:hypothetical protein